MLISTFSDIGSQAYPLFMGWGTPSFQELLVILIIVLIVFGAKRLPEFARALGQSMNEFRKAKEEFEKELHTVTNEKSSLLCSSKEQPPPQQPSTSVPLSESSDKTDKQQA